MKSNSQENLLQSTQHSFIEQLHQQNTIQCSAHKQAFQICANNKCKQSPPFTCIDRKCKCQKQHNFCLKGNLQSILQIIHAKIYETNIKEQIQKLFDKLVDQLSEFRDTLLVQVQKMKYINLSEIQKKILKISKNQLSRTQINNQQTAQLWKIISHKHETKFNVFEELKNNLNKFQISFNQNLQKLKQKSTIQNVQANLFGNKICNSLISQSKIIQNRQLAQKTMNMFTRKIKMVQMIFRASQNQFSTIKFYQEYGKIPNLIFIALTEKDKIFGGYSPFAFDNISYPNKYLIDSKKQSFIFFIKLELEI